MRLVFAGTPSFAAIALASLADAQHDIRLVLTQPDRAAGRGMQNRASAVKQFAEQRGLALLQPPTLRDTSVLERLRAAACEVLVVAAYGLILPQAALDLPRHGALNIHASLLPRWRGAAPIQRAILAGDAQTGISIMRMEAGLDSGPVLAQEAIAITSEDDAGSLQDKLAHLGARMIVAAIAALERGPVPAWPQPDEGVTYAKKIEKLDTQLDWRRPAVEVDRVVRAARPSPGASTNLLETAVKIWRTSVVSGQGVPGEVLGVGREGLIVACGRDALAVSELQRAGGKRLRAAEFLRGQPVAVGQRLGS